MWQRGTGRRVSHVGIGLLGVALAFELTVLTMAFAIGHISGCHLNPAVSFGLVVGGRFKAAELLPYVIVRCSVAILAAALLYFIASGKAGFRSERRPGLQWLRGAFPAAIRWPRPWSESSLTFMFLIVILSACTTRAPGFSAAGAAWSVSDPHTPDQHP